MQENFDNTDCGKFTAPIPSSDRRWHLHDDGFGGGQFSFVILQGRNHDLGFPCVGAVHGLGIVPKGLLGESFRVAQVLVRSAQA